MLWDSEFTDDFHDRYERRYYGSRPPWGLIALGAAVPIVILALLL